MPEGKLDIMKGGQIRTRRLHTHMPEQRQDACRQERYSQQRDELLKAI